LRGAIVGKRCVLGEGVSIYEEAVVADDCTIGSGAVIQSGIRVWPINHRTMDKALSDLIWGKQKKNISLLTTGYQNI
jgi:NDP-sugar pyrophosphorylase family protein